MGKNFTQSDWPSMSSDETDFISAHYPSLGHIRDIEWYSPRPFSTTCLASADIGSVIIKRHTHRLRTAADIREEHAFIDYLAHHHLSVSTPFLTQSHDTVLSNNQWTYEVFPVADGEDLYQNAMSWSPFQQKDHAFAAGKALAQLHRVSASYTAPARHTAHLVASDYLMRAAHPLSMMTQWIHRHPVTTAFLNQYNWQHDVQQILLPLYEQCRPYQLLLTPQWGHNDWHASNLLWEIKDGQCQVATVIDFGLSNKTSALYDIATAIERNMVDWLSLGTQPCLADLPSLHAFLSGYNSISPLNALYLEALSHLLPVVHAEYALSEIDYFLSVTGSSDNAVLAYHDYLLGHAQWFHQHEGQQLIHAIKHHTILSEEFQ